MQASLSRAGSILQQDDCVGRIQTERYFVAPSADGSLSQTGDSPMPGCYTDAGRDTGHGHLTFRGAGPSGDRCG